MSWLFFLFLKARNILEINHIVAGIDPIIINNTFGIMKNEAVNINIQNIEKYNKFLLS